LIVRNFSPNAPQSIILQEVEALQHLRSDYVVSLIETFPEVDHIDKGRDYGLVHLIFEYLPHDLSGLQSYPLPVAHKKWLGLQVLEGLAHIHSMGYVHCDLKGEVPSHHVLRALLDVSQQTTS
jgi:serine/threonine protein kinase